MSAPPYTRKHALVWVPRLNRCPAVCVSDRDGLLASRRGGCGLIAAKTLDRNIKIIAVGVRGTSLRIGPIGRALRRCLDRGRRKPVRDLVLVIDLPAEMIKPGRLSL